MFHDDGTGANLISLEGISMYPKENETTNQVYKCFENIAGPKVATRGVLKVLSIVSARFDFPRLNIIDSAPSGHLKTFTSNKAAELFPKSYTLPLGSDFTIHRLYEKQKKKEGFASVDKKCLLVNDATLLFSSKAMKTKERLVNALAELLSDNEYEYGDFQRDFKISGRASVIMNITTESYNQNQKNLLGNTFDERCLTVFSELSNEEIKKFSTNRQGFDSTHIPTIDMCLKPSRKVEINIPHGKLESRIWLYASEYSWRSVKGLPRTQATIRVMVRANAFLNNRTEVCKEDFWVVEQAKELLINPLQPNKPRIIQMLRNKQSIADICKALNKDYEGYNSYVYRVLNEAKAKGLLA